MPLTFHHMIIHSIRCQLKTNHTGIEDYDSQRVTIVVNLLLTILD